MEQGRLHKAFAILFNEHKSLIGPVEEASIGDYPVIVDTQFVNRRR